MTRNSEMYPAKYECPQCGKYEDFCQCAKVQPLKCPHCSGNGMRRYIEAGWGLTELKPCWECDGTGIAKCSPYRCGCVAIKIKQPPTSQITVGGNTERCNNTMDKWHQRFLDLADNVATWSKDQSRGVGCLIVGPNREIRSTGYNGFPRNIDDDKQHRHERPIKYKWTEHAERNAVYNAARMGQTVDGCSMYSTLYPCADCARAIIQSGIVRLITREPDWENDRFAEDFQVTREMLSEAKVGVIFVDGHGQSAEVIL